MTTVPASAKKAGMRWHSPVRARSTAASARCWPVRSPRITTPRYRSDSDRLIEKANSPASVDATLPP